MNYPKYLYRPDDAAVFKLIRDDKYVLADTFDPSHHYHEYSYEVLMSHKFVNDKSLCRIIDYPRVSTAHGDEYDYSC
jgi:hypothetical protein